jgi:peptidyl-prolyl cis-trans isomerase SurA
MQKKIVEEVEITPEEVRNFSNQYQKRILPFWCRNGGMQIVLPKVSDVEKQK